MPKSTTTAFVLAFGWTFAACGSHPGGANQPAADGSPTSSDAHGVEADNDGVVPPQEYYDALYQQTLTNLDQHAALGLTGSKQVLWINFNGANVTKGYGMGQSFIPCSSNVTIPPSGYSPADQMTIMNNVAAYYSSVNAALVITANKPTSGNYTTMHVGGTFSSIGCSGSNVMGIAPVDAGNRNPNDVGFAFSGENSSLKVISITIAHEAGHSFGLNHVNEQPDIMYPAVNNRITGFLNSTAGFSNQNEPVLLQAAVGQGAASVQGTVVAAPSMPTTSTPVASNPPAGSGGSGATNPPVAAGMPTIPGFPSFPDLSKLLAGLNGGANSTDLMKLAAGIFGLNNNTNMMQMIQNLQQAAQAIGAYFNGTDRDQLLNLLKQAAANLLKQPT